MDFTTITVEFLKLLSNFVGGYGMAIIALTIIVRVCLWPLSETQQRSMKKMQDIQPKIKIIQDRYKSDPQMQQQKMMELWKENKVNPMSGCLPLLIQMPIFILLYSALISPQFIQAAGDSHFLFINRLDTTLRGTAGRSYDGEFSASKNDTFTIFKPAVVYFGDGEETVTSKLSGKNALRIQGDIVPGEPMDLKISIDELNMKYSQLEKVTGIEVEVQDKTTREVEKIKFNRMDNILTASVPTVEVQSSLHYDVLLLILLFGATMVITQKVMMATNKNVPADSQQAQMQKMMGTMMPIMLMVTFVIIPIPAGVMLYLVISNLIQILQTIVINKKLQQDDVKKV